MKKNIMLIFIFLALISNPGYTQSGWIKQILGTSGFSKIQFINQNTGFATTFSGTLYKTTNSGVNWTSAGADIMIYAGYFFDDSNYVLTGFFNMLGIISKYVNGIRTDYTFYPTLQYLNFSATDWLDKNTGFVGGTDYGYSSYIGKVVRTTNGGAIWNDVTPALSGFVNDIKFINSQTGYILDPATKKTTNMGNNWIVLHGIGGKSIAITNSDTFYVVGYISGIYFSSDGGTNWVLRYTGFSTALECTKFLNTKTGWVCGSNGHILKTTNAGESWTKQESYTYATLRSIHLLNQNYLWIAGDSGVVLRTTTGGLSFISYNEKIIPEKFTLEQNYPNPFNQSTMFKFQCSMAGMVKVSVYDLSGREVTTPVNEYLREGTYEERFDGKDLPSGIYFYTLFADGVKVDTRKMILIK